MRRVVFERLCREFPFGERKQGYIHEDGLGVVWLSQCELGHNGSARYSDGV